jgi:hypothetical protein
MSATAPEPCEACGRDDDAPHTAECPIALEQDIEDGTVKHWVDEVEAWGAIESLPDEEAHAYAYFYHIRPISSTCYHVVIFSSKNHKAGLTWLEQGERVTEEEAKAWALSRIAAREGDSR